MGDVYCPTCGEPWDSHHLRFDAVWETDLPEYAVKAYSENGTKPFTAELRSALERDGWAFPEGTNSIFAFLRCPSCPKELKPPPEKAELRQAVAEMLGDDEDAIQTTLEDLGG